MTNYVLGFMFDCVLNHVVLIQKIKPENQAGLYNGIGGKREWFDAKAVNAMVREFREETGLVTNPDQWRHFASIGGSTWSCECFATTDADAFEARTMEAEVVSVSRVDGVEANRRLYVDSVPYLLSMAAHALTNPSFMAAKIQYV